MKCENCPYRFEIMDNLCCGRDYFCILQPSAGTDFQAVDEMGNSDGAEDEECKLPDTIETTQLREDIVKPLKALIRRILKEVKNMGVTITAKNAKYDFDMSYSGFNNLRRNIALALDEEFGNSYAAWCMSYISSGDFEWKAKISERIINKKCLYEEYEDVLDFLYMSDTEGKIDYKTCRKIAGLLEGRMSELRDKSFRYAFQAGNDYEDFVKFLKECVRYRRNMRWF